MAHQQAAQLPGDVGMRFYAALTGRPNPFQRSSTSRAWRVSIPGRQPFGVSCVQPATAAEILAQWPRAKTVEPMHGREARP